MTRWMEGRLSLLIMTIGVIVWYFFEWDENVFPIIGIIVLFLILFLNYFMNRTQIKNSFGSINVYEDNITSKQRNLITKCTMERELAIKAAKEYITVYNKNIWENLKLTNVFCTAQLGSDGISIKGFDRTDNSNSRYFEGYLPTDDGKHLNIWNRLCHSFDSKMTYKELLEFFLVNNVQLEIHEKEKAESVDKKKVVVEEKAEEIIKNFDQNVKNEEIDRFDERSVDL